MKLEEIVAEAAKLSEEERASLASQLLHGLETPVYSVSDEDVRRRMREGEADATVMITFDQLVARRPRLLRDALDVEAKFHKRVHADLKDILGKYYNTSHQLGEDFLAEFKVGFSKAVENPRSFHFDRIGLRRWNLDRFPYHFLYDIHEKYVRVWVLRRSEVTRIDLAEVKFTEELLSCMTRHIAYEYRVLPVDMAPNGDLSVAMCDPINWDDVFSVSHLLNREVRPYVADQQQIDILLDKHYRHRRPLHVPQPVPAEWLTERITLAEVENELSAENDRLIATKEVFQPDDEVWRYSDPFGGAGFAFVREGVPYDGITTLMV
jgi:hypothetical protein